MINDQHYKKHITELGDTREIVAQEDILTPAGIKLISRGARINSATYDRIVKHKLLPPLDHCLTIENPISVLALAQQAQSLIDTTAPFDRMTAGLPEPGIIVEAISKIPLNAPLTFKLTVAREKMPALFSHSVKMAIVCTYLGAKSGASFSELVELATAGLLHDIGIMHIDPELLNRQRELTQDEWQHIYAHPVTAQLLISDFPEIPPQVGIAILEHHERLDGSGYPRGLSAPRLSMAGRLLAVAEVATSHCDSENGMIDCAQVETILKLNMHKLDPVMVGHLTALLKLKENSDQSGEVANTTQWPAVERLSSLITRWHQHYQALILQGNDHDSHDFLSKRMEDLEKAFLSAGLHPSVTDMLGASARESFRDKELQALTRELTWQMRDIVRELRRRNPALEKLAVTPIAQWMLETEAVLKEIRKSA